MKRIVICADGTWQSPGKSCPTNVLRVARAIKPFDSDEKDQVIFYDWGVGSDRKKIAGGLSGVGIDKNIQDCYRFIVQNYDPNDELYFFGFSRGAYTVRSLGGFVRNCGILKRQHAARIPEAYELDRRRSDASHPDAPASVDFRREYSVADKSPIRFIGVWDTVGALGIPVPFWGSLGEKKYLFHDTEPSSIVQYARHAVSIDENREDFEPTLWSAKPGLDLLQVWFAGVHQDIGGGYKEKGLSDAALEWLLNEVGAAGLEIESHLPTAVNPDPRDKQHNEFKGIYTLRDKIVRKIPAGALIHSSVQSRWNAEPKYRKSKALNDFFQRTGGTWNNVKVVP